MVQYNFPSFLVSSKWPCSVEELIDIEALFSLLSFSGIGASTTSRTVACKCLVFPLSCQWKKMPFCRVMKNWLHYAWSKCFAIMCIKESLCLWPCSHVSIKQHSKVVNVWLFPVLLQCPQLYSHCSSPVFNGCNGVKPGQYCSTVQPPVAYQSCLQQR